MFNFGPKSQANQKQVHPNLLTLANEAIKISSVDFMFFEGVRTLEKEQENIQSGASHLHSAADCKHCIQKDGFGHAMDLVPVVNGQPSWDWDLVFEIVKAVQSEAIRWGVKVRWGGVWDQLLNNLDPHHLQKAVDDYKIRHAGNDFLDGVHFELV